jgi:hypothetical protein
MDVNSLNNSNRTMIVANILTNSKVFQIYQNGIKFFEIEIEQDEYFYNDYSNCRYNCADG